MILDEVALRKESVDRNNIAPASFRAYITSLSARRAWIEIVGSLDDILAGVSLSARRAWIEIFSRQLIRHRSTVALRKESVDRNNAMQIVIIIMHASLSARRAWIEIMDDLEPSKTRKVALRKESVDRNTNFLPVCLFGLRRSPQGERG